MQSASDQAGPPGPDWLPATPPDQGPARPGGARADGRVASWRRFAVAALVVVLVVAAAVWVGDWLARATAMDQLVDGIEQSEAAMVAAMVGVSATLDEERGNLEEPSQEVADRLSGFAEQGLDEVSAAAARIESVAIQPWHAEIIAARDVYLEHNDAWQSFLAEAAEDPSAWFASDPEIESTWRALRPVLLAAVPVPSAFGLAGRVDAVLDEGDGDAGDAPTLEAAAALGR